MSYSQLENLGSYSILNEDNLTYVAPHPFVLDTSVLVVASSHQGGQRCNKHGCRICDPICEKCGRPPFEHSTGDFKTNLNKAEKKTVGNYTHLPTREQNAIQEPVIPFQFSQDQGNISIPEVQSIRAGGKPQPLSSNLPRTVPPKRNPPQAPMRSQTPPSRGVQQPRNIPEHVHKIDKDNVCGLGDKSIKAGITCNLHNCGTCRPVCMVCGMGLKRT